MRRRPWLLVILFAASGCTHVALAPAAKSIRVVERTATSEPEEARIYASCEKLGRQEKDDDLNALLNAGALRGADTAIVQKRGSTALNAMPSFGANNLATFFRCAGPKP